MAEWRSTFRTSEGYSGVPIGSCFQSWKDYCRLRKFYKVCVFAFRERSLVRTTKSVLVRWRAYALAVKDLKERQIQAHSGSISEEPGRRNASTSRERRKKAREEDEAESAFTAELNKLKLQAAWNFFLSRFLPSILKAWHALAENGIGRERRKKQEVEKERRQRLAARKFRRLMFMHRAFSHWKTTVKSTSHLSRLNADKEYRALKMQQVLIQKKKEFIQNKENVGPPKQSKHERQPQPRTRESVVAEGTKSSQPGSEKTRSKAQSKLQVSSSRRKYHSEELETSLKKLAARRSEQSPRKRSAVSVRRGGGLESGTQGQSDGEQVREQDRRERDRRIKLERLERSERSERSHHTSSSPQANSVHRRRPKDATKREEVVDIQRNLEERANERHARREELKKRYQEKFNEEGQESQRSDDQTKAYDKRIRELQRIEAKEKIYRMDLEESERMSKIELKRQQMSLAKMHYTHRLMRHVGYEAFAGLLLASNARKEEADLKYKKHLFALSMQAWKLWMMPFWRNKVMFQVHFHGVLSRFLTRYRLDRVLTAWFGFLNAKKFKRHRIVAYHFGFFKGLLKSQELKRHKALEYRRRKVLMDHLSTWKDYTSIRAELVLLHELEMAHTFRQQYHKGMIKRVFDDWKFVTGDLKRGRLIETSKRQTWSKINQWLEELDKEKAEKRELENKVQNDKTSLLSYLSSRDYSTPFAFEDKIDYTSIK